LWERDARVSSVMIAVRGRFSAVWLAPLGDDYRDDAKTSATKTTARQGKPKRGGSKGSTPISRPLRRQRHTTQSAACHPQAYHEIRPSQEPLSNHLTTTTATREENDAASSKGARDINKKQGGY